MKLLDDREKTYRQKDTQSYLYQTNLSKTPIQELKLYQSEQKDEYTNYAAGH
jgi:hypothetical protein